MFADYVTRGVTAGAVAGLVFGLFVALVADPFVGFADGLAQSEGGGSLVTTAVSVLSGVLWGVFLGGVVFGVAFYFLEPALPGGGLTQRLLLAAAGFLTVSGAPWLVVPPRLPGVESTLDTTTALALYGGMLVAGAVASLLAILLFARLRDSYGQSVAAAAAVLPLSLLAVPALLSPAAVASGSSPARLATAITGMVVFGQVLLWLVLAATHTWLCRRSGEAGYQHSTAVTAD